VLPLLVATDGAIKEFGHNGRRLRPNVIIGGVEGLAERSWPGRCLGIGDVLIGIEDLRMRCVMTTFDPDTQQQKLEVLKQIVRKFAGRAVLATIFRGRFLISLESELSGFDPLILVELLLVFGGNRLHGCKLLLKFSILRKHQDRSQKRYRADD
jgi:hypothetical protein